MVGEDLSAIIEHFVVPWSLFTLPMLAIGVVVGFTIWMHGANQE